MFDWERIEFEKKEYEKQSLRVRRIRHYRDKINECFKKNKKIGKHIFSGLIKVLEKEDKINIEKEKNRPKILRLHRGKLYELRKYKIRNNSFGKEKSPLNSKRKVVQMKKKYMSSFVLGNLRLPYKSPPPIYGTIRKRKNIVTDDDLMKEAKKEVYSRRKSQSVDERSGLIKMYRKMSKRKKKEYQRNSNVDERRYVKVQEQNDNADGDESSRFSFLFFFFFKVLITLVI
jgi:Arc/MetJ family transcription regulator